MSNVKDMALAKEGIRKIEWVQKHMPVLEHIKQEYLETQPFKALLLVHVYIWSLKLLI